MMDGRSIIKVVNGVLPDRLINLNDHDVKIYWHMRLTAIFDADGMEVYDDCSIETRDDKRHVVTSDTYAYVNVLDVEVTDCSGRLTHRANGPH